MIYVISIFYGIIFDCLILQPTDCQILVRLKTIQCLFGRECFVVWLTVNGLGKSAQFVSGARSNFSQKNKI